MLSLTPLYYAISGLFLAWWKDVNPHIAYLFLMKNMEPLGAVSLSFDIWCSLFVFFFYICLRLG
jgi:hypothetical protein